MRDHDDLLRALLLVNRYSLDVSAIAASTLGRDLTGNRDIQVLLAVHQNPGITPRELGRRLGLHHTAVSRSVGHLVGQGLAARHQDPRDGRSWPLRLTRKGRSRVSDFERRLSDYFAAGAPLVKELITILDVSVPDDGPTGVGALSATEEMARAGAVYVEEVTPAMAEWGVEATIDRYALTLICARGGIRPTHLAHDLGLSTSGATDLIDRLEVAGLIVRAADPHDRRAVAVTLSPRGAAAADILIALYDQHAGATCRALALTLPPSATAPRVTAR